MSAPDVARAYEAIAGIGRAHHLLLLFDFDGTLCAFHPDPSAVWLADERDEHPRVVPARLPQRHGELVTLAELPAEAAQIADGDPEGFLCDDAVPDHAVAVALRATTLERGQHVLDLPVDRGHRVMSSVVVSIAQRTP